MKNKNIKERYTKAIENLKSRIDSSEDNPIVLKIVSIEEEFDEYNKKSIKNKIDLGVLILLGLVIASIAIPISRYDTPAIEQTIPKIIYSTFFLSLGTVSVAKGIVDYRKQKFNLNVDANKSLEEHENFILQSDNKEKINVKKR